MFDFFSFFPSVVLGRLDARFKRVAAVLMCIENLHTDRYLDYTSHHLFSVFSG